jgi:hypothetical protein
MSLLIDFLNKKIPEINLSKEKFNEDFVGKIYLDNKNKTIIVEDLLKNGEKRVYDLVSDLGDICINNDQIIMSHLDGKCLKIYDEDLNFITRVDRINGEEFQSTKIFPNFEKKQFYICDYLNNRILMTDLDFNLIKSVGSTGSGNCQFLGSIDICFSNSKFYICDYYNKRIQVYSKDFDFVTSFKVDYSPWKIKSTNSTICVEAESPDGIYFYNSNDFHLIRNYNRYVGRISQINSIFYEFNYKTQTMSCYDENANLKEEITLKGFDKYLASINDGALIYHNGALAIQSYSEKKVIKLFFK